VAAILFLAPSDECIFLPDKAHPVAPLVEVEGEKPDSDGGGIFYTNVVVRKATLIERLAPSVREGSTLVPESVIRPHGLSERQRRQVDRTAMLRSQEIAAAVALRELGYRVPVRVRGARVLAVLPDAPADGQLEPGDVILAAQGRPVESPADLRGQIAKVRPGERVRLRVRADEDTKVRTLLLETVVDPDDPDRPVIGVTVEPAAQIDLPIDVEIDLGNVGGPSAGLAFALDVLEELGRPVDRGRRVAVTGGLELDGQVVPIGGVKQKTIGARRAGADVFLVPAGDNAAEARRHADGLRIIPVKSFRQALRALATSPPAGKQTAA
jgi:Lon-like protease